MTRAELRRRALGSLTQGDLATAVERLGFVQADPIRAPARAQDLILRPRVAGYRVGDLRRAYAAHQYEEDLLYAYGFMPRAVRALLHPRPAQPLSDLERAVLAAVDGPTHPRDLDAAFGDARVRGPWGGQSRATKRALDTLHMQGHLRVCARRRGVRVYERSPPFEPQPLDARLRAISRLLVGVFAPARRRYVRRSIGRIAARFGDRRAGVAALDALIRSGAVEVRVVEGEEYLLTHAKPPPVRDAVTFLAPFDPLVHDRDRFAQLWGWTYRFEAYTPPAKRVRGYYALPLLYRDAVIGWVNLAWADDALHVDAGYVGKRPTTATYRRALDAEVARFSAALRAP